MSSADVPPRSKLHQPGTFQYIEAKIRNSAKGTEFGSDFELLCKEFLEHAPLFRGMQFEKIWLWQDWPERWGPDAGIDIVAMDHAGDLWANRRQTPAKGMLRNGRLTPS